MAKKAAEVKETVKAAAPKKRAASKENKFYNEMTLEYMMKYIDENGESGDKDWFKEIAIDSKGKYQHLIAKREFCKKYMPDKLPQKKEKVNKSDLLKNW